MAIVSDTLNLTLPKCVLDSGRTDSNFDCLYRYVHKGLADILIISKSNMADSGTPTNIYVSGDLITKPIGNSLYSTVKLISFLDHLTFKSITTLVQLNTQQPHRHTPSS